MSKLYYTEGYIKTIVFDDRAISFTIEPATSFAFQIDDKTKGLLIVKKDSDTKALNVVSSVVSDNFSVRCSDTIWSKSLVILKATKCRVRAYFKKDKYSEIVRMEVL